MLVLVVNAGSATLKSQLIETDTGQSCMTALADKVDTPWAYLNVSFNEGEKKYHEAPNKDAEACLETLLDILENDPDSPISSLDDIKAIGNRIVSGGDYFFSSVLIDDDVLEKLYYCEQLAPLHNPHADACIGYLSKLLPDTPQVAVFDTVFHQTMPDYAYMYPLPRRYYTNFHIRKYGAHGTSNRWATSRCADLLAKPVSEVNLINCHLGGGCSVTAVQDGKSIDTSMGFTPLGGLMMSTRCGSLDPAVVIDIMRRERISYDEMEHILNYRSGILGVSGVSSDMRNVQEAAYSGNSEAILALKMFVLRIKRSIGAYYAILPRCDAVVMTAGIGENSPEIRSRVFDGLEHLGMILDPEKNNARPKDPTQADRVISTDDSPIKICVIAANEELQIALETAEIVGQ